jgi:multicomponent Na+:H+ antiporter subunit B
MSLTVIEGVLLLFVLACALGTALLRGTLAAIIAFAAYSLGISILWVYLQAPDVALTEAAVGAGVMTLLFILTISNTVSSGSERLFEQVNLRTLALVGAFVLALAATVPALPPVGAEGTPVAGGDVTQYYLDNAYEQTGVHNAVTAVLAAYRGLDTLGEAVVVFTAGIAVLLVLRRGEFT